MRKQGAKEGREPTIALINVVFLMLVFFIVAGTVAQPLDKDLSLVTASDLEGVAPPDALVIYPDGRMTYRGADIQDAATFIQALPAEADKTVRIVPDRALLADQLVALGNALQAEGAERVVIVSERGLE